MPFLPPDVRIARHVEKLATFGGQSKTDEVLAQCGLVRDGTSVHRTEGFVTDDDCYKYKQAVREIYGETAYAFAKVNFVLSGCQCADCSR